MYFDVSVVLLVVLTNGIYVDSAPTGVDYDAEWDKLFGNLSMETTEPEITEVDEIFFEKQQPKPTDRPAAPLIIGNKPDMIPTIGANSKGNMQGVAISRNNSISIGMYIANSSYNDFNTSLGRTTNTHQSNSKGP